MTPTLLNGNSLKKDILEKLADETKALQKKYNKTPGLAVILIGHNPASKAYVTMKKKACEQLGFHSEEHSLSEDITQKALTELIDSLNNNPDINGILLQLPLPPHINTNKMLELISPKKDVDGFHPINTGKLLQGLPCFKPCTPYGILKLLDTHNIETAGKHIVIIGRSNIVGKPIAAMLMQKNNPGNATVTVCHSHTKNISDITTQADIIIAAIGKPNFVTANMIKKGAIVIDVGINRVVDKTTEKGYKLVGDVDFNQVAPKSAAITPVPGGIGPLTIAMLMTNTLQSFKNQLEIEK